MEVAVRVARHRELGGAGQLAQLPLRDDRDHVEVQPPHRGGDGEAEQPRHDRTRVELVARTHAERDDRLAERDDHDQRVTLGEVPGGETPALAAADVGAEQVEGERERPDRDLETAVEPRGDEQEPDADGRPDS